MLDTLLITTITSWEEPPRIRHQIALEMSKYFRSVLFIETPCLRKLSEKMYPPKLRQVASNIFAYRMPCYLALPKNAHILLPLLSELSQSYVAHTINSLIKQTHTEQPVLINFNPSSYSLHALDKLAYSVFVLNDDFAGMSRNKLVKNNILRTQALCASRADLSLAVSVPLFNQLQRNSSNVRMLLPGHAVALQRHNFPPCIFNPQSDKKIRVCFMGYIDQRLMIDWIINAAKSDLVEFILIGPIELPLDSLCELKSAGVQFIPPQKGEELENTLRSCHVLTMPYNINNPAVFATTAPNKLFQYIASLRPIVISNMPNFLDLPSCVVARAADKNEFLDQIIYAAQKDCLEHQKKRLEIAAVNTWEQRGLQLVRWIEDGIREKKKQLTTICISQ